MCNTAGFMEGAIDGMECMHELLQCEFCEYTTKFEGRGAWGSWEEVVGCEEGHIYMTKRCNPHGM